MPDLFDLLARWWKYILGLMILTLLITWIVVANAPKKYLGVATALPAPTYATDKAGVFSENMQTLYPSLGTADDLDMILGTSKLDTVYTAVSQQLNLMDYYGIGKDDKDAARKAGWILKERTRVIKSDYGELKVKVWDADPDRAADMSNGVMERLQQVHQEVQTANNAMMLSNIEKEYQDIQSQYQRIHDSLTHMDITAGNAQILTAKQNSLIQQVQEYEKLMSQYSLMVNAKPQALVITERAVPGLWPDKPRPKQTLVAAALFSLLFGLLAALILERRRMQRK
jgi:uncharacterized protein involved in exopolysaccharide biosynthesis